MLSKIISSCDLYYEVELPKIFFFDHPTGTVIGRANYSNGFSFSQGCTIGNNKGIYPTIGENVHLCPDVKILGNCNIGNNVIFSANTYIQDVNIPSNSIVFPSKNEPNSFSIKEMSQNEKSNYINIFY